MNWKVWESALLGVIFLLLAFVYFTNQAQNLPAFLPGHQAGLTKIHRTHAIASLVVALLLFAFAWFQSGNKRKSSPAKQDEQR